MKIVFWFAMTMLSFYATLTRSHQFEGALWTYLTSIGAVAEKGENGRR